MAAESNEAGDRVLLATSMGDITIQLYSDMPVTAGNFKKLIEKGFYDGVIFHRIIDGFMIQGGDPTGTGRGGPGYAIKDEFTPNSKNDRGTISMANAGPNTGGSQFFINLVDNNFLDGKHPAFGKVCSGRPLLGYNLKRPAAERSEMDRFMHCLNRPFHGGEEISIPGHQPAVLEDMSNPRLIQPIHVNGDVCPVAGCYCPQVGQAEVAGSIERGDLQGNYGIQTLLYSLSQHEVDMPFPGGYLRG